MGVQRPLSRWQLRYSTSTQTICESLENEAQAVLSGAQSASGSTEIAPKCMNNLPDWEWPLP